jgi:ferredoxin
MAERALKQAEAAGAQAIVAASPACYQTLRTAAKKAKAKVEVLELNALVATHMKAREGGAAVAVVEPAEPEAEKEPEIPEGSFRVEYVKEKKVLAVDKNTSILDAALEAGLDLPYSCRAGSCDTCSARWEGTAADQSAGSALTPQQQATFVLTCIARPKGPIKLWTDERPK